MHSLTVGQDTALSSPLGLGVGRIDQLAPSQRSVSGRRYPALLYSSPTAKHDVVEGQATPTSSLRSAPDGLAIVWTVQPVPSQRSASGTCVPATLT